VAFPAPVPGLVLRYAFLWSHEAQAGIEEGQKDRPCAVLLTVQTRSGRHVVTVLPITHRPPTDSLLAVEIPTKTKRRLGLDEARSWIVLSEANRFFWPGPDLRAVSNDKPGEFAYGLLPAALYDEVRTKWLAAFDRGKARQIARSE
jgi:hypothetical protein